MKFTIYESGQILFDGRKFENFKDAEDALQEYFMLSEKEKEQFTIETILSGGEIELHIIQNNFFKRIFCKRVVTDYEEAVKEDFNSLR